MTVFTPITDAIARPLESLRRRFDKRPRSMERLRDEAPGWIALDHARIVERPKRSRGGHDKWVEGAWCTEHWRPIPAIVYGRMAKGEAMCPDCERYGRSWTDRQRELFEATAGRVIGLVLRGNMIDRKSIFECVDCAHVWWTSRNNLIGRAYRRGTGCPACYHRQTNKREAHVEAALTDKGFTSVRMDLFLDEALDTLTNTRGDAVIPRAKIWRPDARELRVDFLIKRNGEIFALEVDGPQHYRMRYRRHKAADFDKIERLDNDKVARLDGYGIAVRRIPLPLAKTNDQIDAMLDAALSGQTPYVGVPRRAWLDNIR